MGGEQVQSEDGVCSGLISYKVLRSRVVLVMNVMNWRSLCKSRVSGPHMHA